MTKLACAAMAVALLVPMAGCKTRGPDVPREKKKTAAELVREQQEAARLRAAAAAKAAGKPMPGPHGTAKAPMAVTGSLPAVNEPPTMEIPAYRAVGVGQEVGFGIEVIDRESDDFLIEVVDKPASATFDAFTMTMVFKPTKDDMPEAHFAVKVTETIRKTGDKRSQMHRFAIAVEPKPVSLPTAQPLSPAVEQLITIHDAERLAEVNKRWTIDKMLARNGELVRLDLPEAERDKVKVDPAGLYGDMLTGMAEAHYQPSLDASSKAFDEAKWGDPKAWKIIAVRPRLDKKWHEVRIVWKHPAHEASYAMFKFRPIGDRKDNPPEALAYNNKAFGELVLKHFFTEGKLNPAHTKDKAAHAKAVAEFVDGVVNFQTPDAKDKPWARPSVHALPMEARLGGGTFRDDDDNIAGGDGWGWHVMKPIVDKEGVMSYQNIPIKGFATGVAPSADGTSWQMACGPAFDPESPKYNKKRAGLCRKTGHTDLPAGKRGGDPEGDEPATSSFSDAAYLFWEHKNVDMVATVPLEDPRRDLFEEKGMTCHQCHVRKFGVRDMADKTAYDPRAGVPKALNKSQATTYFVITPTTHWQPYAIDFQHKQECKAKANLEKWAGAKTDLTCPLMLEL